MMPIPALSLALLAALTGGGSPQDAQPEYAIKARFLVQFPEFVAWPSESGLGDPGKPFVILVLGDSPFEGYLDAVAVGRKVKGHPLKIVYSNDLAKLDGCHMVFVCAPERRRLRDITGRIGARPILTVGDADGFAKQGVVINLTIENSLPRFEINLSAARYGGLGISAQLLGLARKVL